MYLEKCEALVEKKLSSPFFYQRGVMLGLKKLKLVWECHITFEGVHFDEYASNYDEVSWKTFDNWQDIN